MVCQTYNGLLLYTASSLCLVIIDYQMSDSELWPRKVESIRAHSIQKRLDDYCEYLHITTELVNTPTRTTLTH